MAFQCIGEGYTPDGFAEYCRGYNFGSMPPDFVVMHHTAVPTFEQWTGGANTYGRRRQRLLNIASYYEHALGWTRGPHLFIDDTYVWLMTPMFYQGIHAGYGNGWWANGRLHYSIGIEVVGNYTHRVWPDAVANVVRSAVQTLHKRLGTFDLQVKRGVGHINTHRMWGKPACPGNAISDDYIERILGGEREPSYQPGRYCIRSVAGANVRQGPSTEYPVAWDGMAVLEDGHELDISAFIKGQSIGGLDMWAHWPAAGFIHESLVAPV